MECRLILMVRGRWGRQKLPRADGRILAIVLIVTPLSQLIFQALFHAISGESGTAFSGAPAFGKMPDSRAGVTATGARTSSTDGGERLFQTARRPRQSQPMYRVPYF
ncbi:hypothetical protein [Caballeronia temeraria]|uniref:hypothetical protein n=1 Tax=Caballeronia temeraria TaxID=1777137 RepID=UPI0012FDC541|nr:hypothetical protein [Caballeronia temeraria]